MSNSSERYLISLVFQKRVTNLIQKSALAETDKTTLEIARIIKDDFLQQNGYSPYDKYCPFYKTVWMMRNMMFYHEQATHALEGSNGQLSWNKIKDTTQDVLYKLSSMKFEVSSDLSSTWVEC